MADDAQRIDPEEAVAGPGGGAPPPWLLEAERLRRRRRADRPGRRLLSAIERLDAAIPVIGPPWCGLFVAHCLRAARPDLDLPTNQAQARPWLDFGEPIPVAHGAIVVLWRLHPRSGLAHVGFVVGEDDDSLHVLGGNQRDSINVERWPRRRLLGARWPDPRTPRRGPPPARDPRDAKPFEFGRLL